MQKNSEIQSVRELLESPDKTPETFEEYLNCFADQIGDVVNAFLPHAEHPDVNRYLYDPLMKYSQNGGKRHRPLITFAACQAVGGDVDKAVSAAAAIEHFHTAALIHDDIADEAELRRGEPCLHLTMGTGLAINVGDLGLSLVNGTVINDPNLDDATKIRIIAELIDMTRCTIEGQAMDIGWARDGRYDVELEDYMAMATHKTAHYSGAVPLAIGAIAGGGTEEQIKALRDFGLSTGLAFQIQDDLLNLLGEEGAKKKDFRSDITEGKRTMVVVHALRNSQKRDRLIEILSNKETDADVLQEAVDIMTESGSIEFVRSYAEDLVAAAKENLIQVIEPSHARDLLISMADWFVSRLR